MSAIVRWCAYLTVVMFFPLVWLSDVVTGTRPRATFRAGLQYARETYR